jgi:hypothetical protein
VLFGTKDIHDIRNLEVFVNLTTLKLDNNHIQKIEGLSSLVNLEWLDLSFNNIEKIEGLEMLTKLRDLTLYGNRITTVENMEMLVCLSCFSIGKNQLSDVQNVKYLRQFDELRMLTIQGNPIASEPDHRFIVLAHLPRLKYLDYQMVEESEFLMARERHEDRMHQLEEEDQQKQERKKKQEVFDAEEKLLLEANSGGMMNLFERMLKEDSEFSKIDLLTPLFEDQLREFSDQFATFVENFKQRMLEQHEKKETDRKEYDDAVQGIKNGLNEEAKSIIKSFEKKKKKALAEIHTMEDDAEIEKKIRELKEENSGIATRLLELEMTMVENMEKANSLLERSMETISVSSKDLITNIYPFFFAFHSCSFPTLHPSIRSCSLFLNPMTMVVKCLSVCPVLLFCSRS